MSRIALAIIIVVFSLFVLIKFSCKKEDPTKPPTVKTLSVGDISSTTAMSGGDISDDGGSDINSKGIVWCTNLDPTIENHSGITNEGVGKGVFKSTLTNLTPATQYNVRAYATNSAGTSYGNQITFTTTAASGDPPSVTTVPVTNITQTAAASGGNVTSQGSSAVTARGVCWSTSPNPTIANNKTINGSGTGFFTSSLTGLSPTTTYYVRAYATNTGGTAYGSEINFTTQSETPPTVTTTSVSAITSNSATTGGNVTSQGSSAVTARGVCWSTSPNPTTANNAIPGGTGTGSFTSNITGLSPGTTYYVRAYATNSTGTAYGNQESFTTPINHCAGVTAPPGYGIVESSGKCWLDRNLGASQVATSSTDASAYGDLYQWGRGADGHQIRTSATTSTLSSSNTPGHSSFILAPNSPYDWRSPQNNNLWQGLSGVNNPCPPGWRIPTEAEWDAERLTWSSFNAAGAFASPLKLPMAGYRGLSHGSLYDVGSVGYYWSSTVFGTNSRYLNFLSISAIMYYSYRASGFSVRCLKDNVRTETE